MTATPLPGRAAEPDWPGIAAATLRDWIEEHPDARSLRSTFALGLLRGHIAAGATDAEVAGIARALIRVLGESEAGICPWGLHVHAAHTGDCPPEASPAGEVPALHLTTVGDDADDDHHDPAECHHVACRDEDEGGSAHQSLVSGVLGALAESQAAISAREVASC